MIAQTVPSLAAPGLPASMQPAKGAIPQVSGLFASLMASGGTLGAEPASAGNEVDPRMSAAAATGKSLPPGKAVQARAGRQEPVTVSGLDPLVVAASADAASKGAADGDGEAGDHGETGTAAAPPAALVPQAPLNVLALAAVTKPAQPASVAVEEVRVDIAANRASLIPASSLLAQAPVTAALDPTGPQAIRIPPGLARATIHLEPAPRLAAGASAGAPTPTDMDDSDATAQAAAPVPAAPVARHGAKPLAPAEQPSSPVPAAPRATGASPSISGDKTPPPQAPATNAAPAQPPTTGAQLAAQGPVVAAVPARPAAPAQPDRIDFAQLVDTIARAREHAGAQSVQATLSHAEFGAVAMKFHHDGDVLAVSLTSADPGFVAAANAAQASTDSTAQRDAPAQHGQRESVAQGAGQGSGQTAAGNEGQPGTQGSHAQATRRTATAAGTAASTDRPDERRETTDRSGRFA
ncbi:MAG: hypothetical protein KGL48_16560 [Sphingomonadales bacterium]|nr:hypothetical protein [Sphingomonadales bacterium]MDE2569045.1 hypothetical protein [Sphingomonadales bacterium]